MINRLIVPVLIVAAAFGILLLLGSFKKEQKRMPPRPFVRTVATQRIHYGNIRPTVFSMGRVTAFEQISLTPEVSGIILSDNFRLRKGLTFKKGDLLLRIDSSQIYYSLNSTVSDLQNALAGLLPEVKTDHPESLENWSVFFRHCTVDSLPPLPSPGSDREKLLATRYNVYKLYFLASQQQNTLQKHSIRAPFSGTVQSTQVYPGSMARAGVAVATIVRTDAIEIELALTEDQLPFVSPGMGAVVKIEGVAEPVTGTVQRISNVLDERMQTAAAFIRIGGAVCKSGAYAEVTISGTALPNATAIPRKALHRKKFVYIIEADTLAEREVSAAYVTVDTAYITGGIAENSVLISEPLQDAVIGMPVQSPEQARIRQQNTEKVDPGKTSQARGKAVAQPRQQKKDSR